ncbi:MAG: SDR family oxidoreductase [Anaerolineaceae bacterium]|nr:SDR family oxidoreductase [Anaerolineaceae bacterium]
MKDKVCMVTGATSGIGLVTAQELASMGAKIVIVGRNSQKGEQIVAAIKEATGNSHVELMLADLSEQSQIRKLVSDFKQRYDRLNVLVNNAGAMFLRRIISPDGFEMTFAVNYLNYFLLTSLLLDVLKSSAPARIVNVASRSHEGKLLDFDDLQSEKKYQGMDVYGKSKLGNIYFTYELARRLEGSNVTVNSLHPGFVATNMGTNNGWFVKLFWPLLGLFAVKPQEGARTSIYLASSPEVEGVSGKYFMECKEVPSSSQSYDEDTARRLWQISEELTGMK